MNLLAIVGSPRIGKATDTLVDKAIEGFRSKSPNSRVKKINLIEHDIQFCKNCLACRESKTDAPIAECTIQDDMEHIKKEVLNSDALIFGTPVHMGYATAVMMTFLERICWTFGKPERKVFTIEGCPLPRSEKQRKETLAALRKQPHIWVPLADGRVRPIPVRRGLVDGVQTEQLRQLS